MGRVDKKKKCSVEGCENEAERSLNIAAVSKSGLKVKENKLKKAYLCKVHYKEYKKKTKKDREVERWRWNT
ncbi:MAG: hypothetical protein ACTSVY_01100 [Candidatus Helarchaeota archaeon]